MNIKQIAIIGQTASGKSALAIDLALQTDAYILSLDSLSIYKEIDIVSAKPTIQEQQAIPHFGIDEIYPNEPFSVATFISLYKEVYTKCTNDGKPLIIVGGTSFYLKTMIDGISPMPKLSSATIEEVDEILSNLPQAYEMLCKIDSKYASNIASSDRYRIQKALEIYLQTSTPPTLYFQVNPPKSIIEGKLDIYEILWDRDSIRDRIHKRTKQMVQSGLIDEIAYLEYKYTRSPNPMKAIGIKETLDYLDGRVTKDELIQKISTNTARLAKRQKTFNNSQFRDITKDTLTNLKKTLKSLY
jgi:tRNA dimethylallyltransferase